MASAKKKVEQEIERELTLAEKQYIEHNIGRLEQQLADELEVDVKLVHRHKRELLGKSNKMLDPLTPAPFNHNTAKGSEEEGGGGVTIMTEAASAQADLFKKLFVAKKGKILDRYKNSIFKIKDKKKNG